MFYYLQAMQKCSSTEFRLVFPDNCADEALISAPKGRLEQRGNTKQKVFVCPVKPTAELWGVMMCCTDSIATTLHRLWCSLTTNRQTSVQGRKTCTEPLALSVTHLEFEKETRWIQAEWAYSAFMRCQENESLTGDIHVSEKPLAL